MITNTTERLSYSMARIPSSPHPIECPFRYYLVYDRQYDFERDITIADDIHYGLIRIPTVDAFPGSRIDFYNDTSGRIDLFPLIREYSQAEWETLVVFDALPVLHTFDVRRELHQDFATRREYVMTVNKVRFNDH